MADIPDSASDALFDPNPGDLLADRAASQIEMHILNGLLKSGAKLPGERDLAQQLDVSRPKLREALQLLESRGLVNVIAGDGAYISELSGPAMSPALIALYIRHPTALDDHLEYRKHQEGFAARLAAERATDEDQVRIMEIVDELKKVHQLGDLQRASELDLEFHTAIVETSYNRTLIHTMESLYDLNRSALFANRQELFESPTVGASLLNQHAKIAEAIIAGDGIAAERAATDHVEYVRASLAEAISNRHRETISRKRRIV